MRALYIWQGGLGIWGAIAGGALGVYIAARRRHLSFVDIADAVAPALPVAQAIGRWGNWWNQEIYGGPTSLPWAADINKDPTTPGVTHYQPTFLYESLWDVSVALICIWADRRFRLDRGRVFVLYVALYCAGRSVTEALRSDHASLVLGLRVNEWVSVGLFVVAVTYLVVVSRRPRKQAETGGRRRSGAGATVVRSDAVIPCRCLDTGAASPVPSITPGQRRPFLCASSETG